MSHERMSDAQLRAVEELAQPGRKLKWDGESFGYIVPGWKTVFAGTAKNLERRKLLKRTNAKKDALGFYEYTLRKKQGILKCSSCGKRKPDDAFNRSNRKDKTHRRGRVNYCRDCEKLNRKKRNGKDAPDLQTSQQKYAAARKRLDPGPHADVQAQYEALRL